MSTSQPLTGAAVLADFHLTDSHKQPRGLIRTRVEALAQYAANYHASYEKLSAVLWTRTKALRDVEARAVEDARQLERLRVISATQASMVAALLTWHDALGTTDETHTMAALREAIGTYLYTPGPL